MSDIAIETLLGGTDLIGHSLKTEMDMYTVSRIGIPKKSLVYLTSSLNLSIRSIAQLLNITERTIQRKSDLDLLDVSTSEQILQIAEVFSRGSEVFQSSENFKSWMNTPNMALAEKKPMELLASRYGAQMILDEIGRIEQGIYS